MPSVVRAIVEAVRDPLAQKLTQSRKYAWNLADVFKSVISGASAFILMLPVIEILQLVAGHSEQFGERGPLVSAVCVLLIQLYRTFHQGKPGDSDGGNSSDSNHPTGQLPPQSPSPAH